MAVATESAQLGVADYIALVNRYVDKGLTDGLPIVPPSNEAVLTMCTATGLAPDYVVGRFPIRPTPVTVKEIATNALMAGCAPDHMPVVVAAYEALFVTTLDGLDAFGTSHMTQSTLSGLPMLVVNGPVRHRLGIRSGANAFGPGARANAVIGRALRLGIINLAASNPNAADRSTVGSPYRLTTVVGEDEENSPWPPISTEYGFESGQDTVLTMKVSHPSQFALQAETPEQFLDTLVDYLSRISNFRGGPPEVQSARTPSERWPASTESLHVPVSRRRIVIFLGEEHRWLLANWTREKVYAYLGGDDPRARRTRTAAEIRASNFLERVSPDAADDTPVRFAIGPENFVIISVGGRYGNAMILEGSSAASGFVVNRVRPIPVPRPATISTAPRSPIADQLRRVERAMDLPSGDGLPIVVPSTSGIDAMIAATGRPAEHVIGQFARTIAGAPLAGRPFSVGDVAATAFTAGCLPEHMPVLTTALEILLDPRHDMHRTLSERDGSAPWVVLNGPARASLNVNCGRNVFGPYFRANAAMGRALNLCLRNIGGLDQSFGLGTAFAYTGGVFGEFEEDSPWAPLSTEYGFTAADNTVAVFDCAHHQYLSQFEANHPEQWLNTVTDFLATLDAFVSPDRALGAVLAIGSDHRLHLKEAGWTRQHVAEYVVKHTGRTAGELRARGFGRAVPDGASDDTFIRLFEPPQQIISIAAGGGGVITLLGRARLLDVRRTPDVAQ
jgi:hypothetical protein